MENILSYIIFLPLAFAFIMGIFRVSTAVLRVGTLTASIAVLLLSIQVLMNFDTTQNLQMIYIASWIKSYGITYYVGLDAISLVVLLLVAVLMPLIILFIWNEDRKGYFYNLLLLQTGVVGTIVALDLVLFYLFWETMLLPIFILIGRYGYEMRQFNAMKIIVMTIFGSMTMLFAILYLGYVYYQTFSYWSFALSDLAALEFDPQTTILLASGFLLAFAIKIPLVGFHTWMAPAYSSSPTPGLIVLSAIMAKLGVYGVWRFGFGLFDTSLNYYAPLIIVLSLIGVIYYAVHAIMEKDLKRMFAFSSGSHLSLIALGLFLLNSYAWNGSLYLVATHALASAGIFLMIGMIGRRTKTITINELGGIATVAPKFAFFFAFFALCIAGIPGTGGFVAELLIIVGAFKYDFWVGVFTATTMIAAIVFVFWMLQRTIYGKTVPLTEDFKELTFREFAILLPLVLLLLATGIFPSFFMDIFDNNIAFMLNSLGGN